MFAVLLMEVRGDLEAEAGAIGSVLGQATYDVKSRVLRGLPKIVLQSSSADEAQRALRALRERGHGVVMCDSEEVVPSEQMVRVRRFNVDESGLWANGRAGDRLAFADLGAVVVAAIRTPVVRLTKEVVSNGEDGAIVEHAANETAHANVAYLFPHTRADTKRPWLLDEQAAHYLGLGPSMQSTRQSNFLATLDLLRDRARHAVFDTRLASGPRVLGNVVRVRDSEIASALSRDRNLDMTAYALAKWLMRGSVGGPYRG